MSTDKFVCRLLFAHLHTVVWCAICHVYGVGADVHELLIVVSRCAA